MARFNFLCVALFIYIVYKTCSKRRQGIYGIYSGIAGRQRYYRPGREGIENPAGGWKGKRISVWSGSGRKSFIESAGTGMYPCALICKICSFEKLTRNCVAASKLQNPMRLSARVATPRYELSDLTGSCFWLHVHAYVYVRINCAVKSFFNTIPKLIRIDLDSDDFVRAFHFFLSLPLLDLFDSYLYLLGQKYFENLFLENFLFPLRKSSNIIII